jgi:cytochrome c553
VRGRPGAGVAAVLLAAVLVPAPGLALAADARAGRQKAAACVPCHGELGLSARPDAPSLAGQPAPYLAAQLRLYRSGKRSSEVMAVVARPLKDGDIDDLAAWFESVHVEASAPP